MGDMSRARGLLRGGWHSLLFLRRCGQGGVGWFLKMSLFLGNPGEGCRIRGVRHILRRGGK